MKTTIVAAAALHDASRIRQIPTASPLVIDYGREVYDAAALEAVKAQGYEVRVLRAVIDPTRFEHLEPMCASGGLVVGVLSRRAKPEELLRIAAKFRGKQVRFQMPLEDELDLTAFRMLSSLGVATAFDLRALRTHLALARELALDAQLSLVNRAPITPLDELRRGMNNPDFEIAALDLAANDHHVDLRTGGTGAAAWTQPDVEAKRIPFLLERHPCAFCEGLMLCHGHLFAEAEYTQCQAFFADFMVFHAARLKRDAEQRPAPSPRLRVAKC